VLGMYVALYVLCGFYIYHRDPRIIDDLGRLATLLSLVVVTVTLMILTGNAWRAELVPLMLFGMAVAIAYEQEIALLLSAAITLVSVIALGHSLSDAVVLMAATAGAILLLGRVRSRSKLLSVGFLAAGVAALTTIGIGTLEADPISLTLKNAALLAIWAVIAGSLMTCLLPLVEKVFKVQTDLSLIELGDPAHPLLQELIRRAPGTYNHSITVASLAEAAAESIGARGLLVRVGAYFHDIGKMLKPGYFVENQGQGDNRHRSLVPAMSTLVIIAHVKDGADLARQSKIPEPIIDFIQQHHGTTLVEYFYRQANEIKKADPHSAEVDESSFRYPGPKPQSKEAGILMLADAVESASRVLVEPTPARIENLVEDISRKRLLDGQFDECGLTLEEVSRIGDSLVKSLTAVYHGRVKYPGQETA
jgi:putative nucleotidyltransferase with HDIG domain